MTTFIPLFSAEKVNAALDLISPVKRVLDNYHYILGDEVKKFEKEFAAYCGVEHCISLANGTDALELALKALDIHSGDKVVLAANAGFYGSTAVHLNGAVPHYIDIDRTTLTMSVEKLKKALKLKPKAIIVTHLYGQLADIETIVDEANKFGVPVIEDCAQAHGAERNGRRAGSFGTIGCFSFYPTKNLGALGDGGAIVTSNGKIGKILNQLRQYGWGSKYSVDIVGGRNSRLDEIQAAILRIKLPYLDNQNSLRRDIAIRYNKAFAGSPIICPQSLNNDNVAHLYVVQINERDSFRDYLKECGIMTDVHYPIPDHLQAAYQSEQKYGDLPETEQVCTKVVTLPCYPGMPDNDVEIVIDSVSSWFNENTSKNSRKLEL